MKKVYVENQVPCNTVFTMSFVSFGEIMLRLTSSEHGGKLADAKSFTVNFAGSESNVASSLAILGNKVKFVTKLPANQLGEAAIRSLNSYGVDTTSVLRGGSRLGTYFIELGSSIRPSKVVYDRSGSSISEISHGEFDWEQILLGKSWIFISGITPALSDQCAEETILLAATARKLGVKVCFDFNYRRTLWSDGKKSAKKVFTKILENTNLLCGNCGALSDVYGMAFKADTEVERTARAVEIVQQEFGIEMLAFTVREHVSASQNNLSSMLRVKNQNYVSTTHTVDITDRFGTGDAFAAALLHALYTEWDAKKSVQFATAAFCLKHTIGGDQHTSLESEILSIMEGKISGHVLR